MSKNQDIGGLFDEYVMPTYAPGSTLVRGHGTKVFDADNMAYLDFTSGIAVCNVGHCHPKVVEAIEAQAGTLMHVSNLFYTTNQALLAQKLSELSLGGKCFFCNSGAEANEAMIKLARLWGHEKGRYEVIAMEGSFHGRTLATAAATGQSKIQEGFDPMPAGFQHATFNDLDSVKALINERTAAVIVEAVQGEGGVIPADAEFMTGLRTLCDKEGILLMCDEVQCGMGRTGKWFGYQNFDIVPDVISLAKGLGSGLPIGAIVAKPEISDTFQPGNHATTFGGNPVCCAAALAGISVMEEEKLPEHAQRCGVLFVEGLKQFAEKYKQIIDVRGCGLMIGMVLEGEAKPVVEALAEMGLLALSAGPNIVRFLPPLNVTDDELEEGMDMISDALDEVFGEEEE